MADNAGLTTLTPEEAARLPGPRVNLPQVPAGGAAAQPGPVIEVAPRVPGEQPAAAGAGSAPPTGGGDGGAGGGGSGSVPLDAAPPPVAFVPDEAAPATPGAAPTETRDGWEVSPAEGYDPAARRPGQRNYPQWQRTDDARSGRATNGAPAPASPDAVTDRHVRVFQQLRREGLSEAAAAGIVANLHHESGVDADTRPGDGGASQFIAQWNGPRLAALRQFAGIPEGPIPEETQVRFILHELREGGPQEREAYRRLRAAGTAAEAAEAFSLLYERPAGREAEARARGRTAEAMLADLVAGRPVRLSAGPRGTVAGTTDDVVPARGVLDLLRRLGRITPDSMPLPRAQDFIDTAGGRIAVREATEAEAQEVADILGRPGGAPMRMVSTQGAYMPTDVGQFIGAVREANRPLFDRMRRSTQTAEEQIALAERIGLDGAVNRMLRRTPGQAHNSEELIAGTVALVNLQRETTEAAAALLTNPSPEAQRRFGLNFALTSAVAAQLNGAVAEAGRALGALRHVQHALNASPPEQLGQMAQRLGVLGQAGPDALRVGPAPNDEAIVDLLGGGEVLRTTAASWMALPDPRARTAMAQRGLLRRTADAIIEAYVNSLLMSPATHIRNLMGNATMGLWQLPERFLAGVIGTGRRAVRLGSAEQAYMGEAHAMLFGMYQGLGDAFRLSAEALRTGMPAGATSKLDLPQRSRISAEALGLSGTPGRAMDLFGTVMRTPGRALGAADVFFRTFGERGELYAQAWRERNRLMEAGLSADDAADRVAEYLAHPPERWRDAADATARNMTFQQEMGPALQALADAMQHPAAKLVVPFFSTPTNVARAVIQRSPLGLAVSPQVWADISAGGARADLAMSRIALGSTLMWWFSSAVMDGAGDPNFRLTGSAPGNPARAQAWRRQGFQEHSVCRREDGRWTCRSYAGADPLSGLVAMAADTANYLLDHPDADPGVLDTLQNAAVASAFGLYQYTLDQPFMQGVSDLARAMGSPNLDASQRFAATVQALSRAATNAVISPLTGGTLGGSLARATEAERRSAMPPTGDIARSNPLTRGFYEALERNPMLRQGDQPLLNVWGETVRPTEDGLWQLFWPIRSTSGRADQLEAVLYRLGGVLQLPGRNFPGTNVALDARQYNALLREMNSAGNAAARGGQTMREEMAERIGTGSFLDMDPGDQIQALRTIRDRRWEAARRRVLEDSPDLARRVERDRDFRRQFGRSPRDAEVGAE
ncbi:phage tail tip lysozyme [Roseomonas sp. NAR14]|uniref:Phage tail tip lysozyme n=1 Tax=Roseomonas acroporae TaxID=2937791 RepID=A0A9X1YF62_9PROT|nr:phage tail tip lysozyme [Roseomonas acroporae]MCK8787985.1 phage tail tip lysozyme [Roseomonas acroporae]